MLHIKGYRKPMRCIKRGLLIVFEGCHILVGHKVYFDPAQMRNIHYQVQYSSRHIIVCCSVCLLIYLFTKFIFSLFTTILGEIRCKLLS